MRTRVQTLRIIGLDPGLRRTGWGVIACEGPRLSYVASGTVVSDASGSLSARLLQLFEGLSSALSAWRPDEAAAEQTFVNRDASATLKLGQARGVVLLAPAMQGLAVAEYAPNLIKKSVVGTGHGGKRQVHAMVRMLLPRATPDSDDAADALAVAITHAHHRASPTVRLAACELTEVAR